MGYCYFRDMDVEISKRIQSKWKTFTLIMDELKAKLEITLHYNFFNITILPVMLYTNETWATMKEVQRLISTQRAMGRSLL